MTRRGWRTSEFWITIATEVGVVAASLTQVLSPRYAAIASAVAAAAYAVSRGLAKQPGAVTLPVAPVPPVAQPPSGASPS